MSDPDRTSPSLAARRGLLITAAMGAAGAASIVGSSSASAAEPPAGVGPFDRAILNANDRGAAGDGATDDTAAAGVGGAVFLPSATYLVSGTLRPKAAKLIFGVGTRPIIRSSGEHSIFVANQPVRFLRLVWRSTSGCRPRDANSSSISPPTLASGVDLGNDPEHRDRLRRRRTRWSRCCGAAKRGSLAAAGSFRAGRCEPCCPRRRHGDPSEVVARGKVVTPARLSKDPDR